jgi:cysteine desulfuration protein SufE
MQVMSTPTIDDIAENFVLLDDWEDRYRYLIELGRTLLPLDEADRTPEKKVQGCVSQVWVTTQWRDGRAYFAGDSDAHIVKGLVAVLVALFSGKTARQIIETDAWQFFRSLDLEAHLTPQRSNGLKSVVERIRSDARQALAAAA